MNHINLSFLYYNIQPIKKLGEEKIKEDIGVVLDDSFLSEYLNAEDINKIMKNYEETIKKLKKYNQNEIVNIMSKVYTEEENVLE